MPIKRDTVPGTPETCQFTHKINQGKLFPLPLTHYGVLSVFEFHFIRIKSVNGETEFIPHLAKIGWGLQRKIAQITCKSKRKQALDVEV